MTIKMLRELIANMPDDARIFADDSSYSTFGDDASEFVCVINTLQKPGMVVLQSKKDIDVLEELNSMAEVAIDDGWSDDDFYREALERGFTYEDFPDPEHAKKQMEYYGLI